MNYPNLGSYGSLLFKVGRFEEALKIIKQAIEIAEKQNFHYLSYSELADQIVEIEEELKN